MLYLYYFPLVAIALSWVSTLRAQIKLSKVYDGDGRVVSRWDKHLPPFLPDDEFVSKERCNALRMTLISQQKKNGEGADADNGKSISWALVTGASSGIGRAIAISLARRRIPVILVARDKSRLHHLSTSIEDCYGVHTLVIESDLSNIDAVTKISEILEKKNIDVDILVNNVGVGGTYEVVAMSDTTIDQLCQLNIVNTTKITQLLGAKMKAKGRGRIAFMSSLTGAVAGVPGTAVYAATKSYQRSFAASLGREMEDYGVGVTCIIPGAVAETKFASSANMANAIVWKFPIGRLTPEIVAESTVRSIIGGRQEIVVGWVNALLIHVVGYLIPSRLVMLIAEFSWKPPPILSKSKQKNKGEE